MTRSVCFLAGTVLCFLPPVALQAQVVLDNDNNAAISQSGQTTDILTNVFEGGVGVNRFTQFDLASGRTLNLIQPDAASALVNIVTGGTGSRIAGTLNFVGESGQSTNAFLADPNGISIVNGGTVTGQRLTLSTAQTGATVAEIVSNTAALSGAEIRVETGGTIAAESVSIWTAGNLALYGLITAKAPDAAGTPVTAAVNTSHVQSADHATVQNGVIRFGAGTATVGGGATLQASGEEDPAVPNARQGGQIRAEAANQLVLEDGATLSVEGVGYDAGSIALNSFEGGDIWIADGALLDASSDSASGGFIYVQGDTVKLGGTLDLAGAAGLDGSALITAQDVALGTLDAPTGGSGAIFDGMLVTRGGDATVVAGRITLSAGALIDTTGATGAGDLTLAAAEISAVGATITANATGTDDGRVALVADQSVNANGLFLSPAAPAGARITLDQVTIEAGAIVVSATAAASNTVTDAEADATQTAYNAEEQANGSVSAAINALTDAAISAIETGRNAAISALPLDWQEVTAEAQITISESRLTATGDWDAGTTGGSVGPLAAHGFFGSTGAGASPTTLVDAYGVTAAVSFADSYDPVNETLYVQSHAQTVVNIAPETESLSLAVAKVATNSAVVVTDSALSTDAGDVVLASTAFADLSLGVSVNGGTAPTTVAIAQEALNNQLLVSGGSINAAGALTAGAFTGRSHQISNQSQGNGEADLVLALTYATSDSLTQAALGGQITAQRVDLGAETLYFDNTHSTTATMFAAAPEGTDEPENSESTNDAAEASGSRVQSSLTGEDESGAGNSDSFKDKTAVGAAIDVQLTNDVTTATLGGAYLGGGNATVQIGDADVTTTGAVSVTAAQRYATANEAGTVANPSLTRGVLAQMGSIAEIIDANTDSETPPTDDKKFGFFYGMSLAELGGTTTAEIGADARVDTPDAVHVDALSQFQTTAQVLDFDGRFDAAMNLSGLGAFDPLSGDAQTPDFALFEDIFDPAILLTTTVGVKTLDDSSEAEDQERTLGVSVNLFEVDVDTRALIADGAVIMNAADLDVTARAEAVFVHAAANGGAGNLITGSPSTGAGALVGANVSVPRIFSDVEAAIGDAVLTDIGTLDVQAINDITQLTVSKSGGLEKASSVAINAAVAAAVFETETTASLGARAEVSATDVAIVARDDSRLLTIAGAGGFTNGSAAATASGAINIVRRDTRAFYGLDAAGVGSFAADSLIITSANEGVVLATAIAGSANSGSSTPAGNMAIPGGLLGSDANAVGNAGGGTNFAGAGSLSMNLMQQNDARAILRTGTELQIADDLRLTATNTTDDLGLSGGVAVGYDLTGGANLIAGAVAFKQDNRSVITELGATRISAQTVTATANDATRATYVAVGGSGGAAASATTSVAGSLVRIEEEGVTLVSMRNTEVTTPGALTLEAQNRNTMLGIAGGASATIDKSVGLSSAQISSVRDARVDLSNAQANAAAVRINARQAPTATTLSLSAAIGKLGAGGTVALSTLSGSAIINGEALVITADDVQLTAVQDSDQNSYAGGLSAGTATTIGAAAATSENRGGAQVLLSTTEIYAETVALAARGEAALQSRSFGLSFNTSTGVGLATSVNISGMQVLTDVNDSRIFARDTILIDARATTSVDSTAVSLAGAGSSGAAGSAIYNDIGNTVSSVVRGDADGSDLRAGGTIAVLAEALTVSALLGGEERLPDANGNFAAGGTAAIGVSLTVNDTNNQVSARILDASRLVGYANSGLALGTRLATDGGTNAYGVIIDAHATTNVDTLATSVALAGKAAVTAAFTYNTLADNAVVQIGNGANITDANGTYGDGRDVSINVPTGIDLTSTDVNDMAFASFYGAAAADLNAQAAQVTRIGSSVVNTIDDWAILVAGSGGGAVGASGTGNLILSRAETTLNSSNIAAIAQVDVAADIDSTINAMAIGLSVGPAAANASVVFNRQRADAQVNLRGARISSEGGVGLAADNRNSVDADAGVLALGKLAGSGASITNVVDGSATVTVDTIATLRDELLADATTSAQITDLSSFVEASGRVDVQANTQTTIANRPLSGSGGGAGLAASVAVSLIDTNTRVEIGSAQAIVADVIALRALEETQITDRVGVGIAAAAGFGGSVNFVDFNGGATVFVGQGADLEAAGNLTIGAIADRRIDSQLGVASVAAGALNVVVSIINVDGSAGDQRSEAAPVLDRTQASLGADQTAGNAGQTLLAETGASQSANANRTAQSGTDVRGRLDGIAAEGLRDVGVQIGAGARLISGGDLAINALVNADISQEVGILAAGGLSVNASLGMINLSSRVDVVVGQDAVISAVDGLTISAQTTTGNYEADGSRASDASDTAPMSGGFDAGAIRSDVTALALSASFNVGAGASLIDLSSASRVDVLDGVALSTSGGGSQISILATRADRARAEIKNAGLAGIGALGVTYTQVHNTGQAEVIVGRRTGAVTRIAAETVALRALDESFAEAISITAQGGGLAAVSGAFATARNSAANALTLNRTQMIAGGTVTLDNRNAGVARADAYGLAVAGAGSLVVSDATAELNAAVTTTIDAVSIDAARIVATTEVSQIAGENVSAFAETLTLAGGLAGSGAFADAKTAYTVTTVIDGGSDQLMPTALVSRTGSVLIRSGADGVTTRGVATGKTVGALAVGAVIADVGQGDGTARVTNQINSGFFSARENLLVEARNDQNLIIDVTTGSGAILGGDFSQSNLTHRAVTATDIGTDGQQVYLQAGDLDQPDETRLNGALTLRAVQSADVTAGFDNTAASLVGVSGAISRTRMNADVDLRIGSGTTAYANFAEVSAQNNATRLANGRNMDSQSGGLATGAVLDSTVSGIFNVDTLINDGALLVQIGDPDLAKPFRINTKSFYNIGDYLVVDAAGVLAAPFGETDVTVIHRDAVTINDATVRAAGDLIVSSGATAVVTAQQSSTASGLAGVPSAKAYATYNGDSAVTINAGAALESLSDITLSAGYVNAAEQQVTVSAEARVFNRTATPISLVLHPVADATSLVNAGVTIAPGAEVLAYQDLWLNASEGVRNVRGYGLAKDFYLELVSDAASLAGVSLVLDITTGSTIDSGQGTVDIAGTVKAGAYNRQILNFDANNVVDNTQMALPDGSGFESQDNAPLPGTNAANVAEIARLTSLRNEVQVQLDGGSLDQLSQNRLQAVLDAYDRRLSALRAFTVTVNSDEVARLRALQASVQQQLDEGGLNLSTRDRLTEVVASYERRINALGGDGAAPLTRIDVGYLRASEGSVRINATTLTGAATGSVSAADEADIRIQASSGAIVSLQGLEITEVEGGEISFNGALLTAADPAYAFDVSFARNYDEPPGWEFGDNTITVSVSNVHAAAANATGDIEILGRIVNRQGGVRITSTDGSIYSQGNVEAESVELNAALGIEIVSPAPGVVYAGPAPYISYRNTITDYQALGQREYDLGVWLNNGANIGNFVWDPAGVSLTPPVPVATAGISAGGNIVLVAEYLNVSAPIRAGTGAFKVNLQAALQPTLNEFAQWDRSDRIKLQAPGSDAPGLIAGRDVAFVNGLSADTNADVYYNFATDQIEIDPIRTNGGAIFITADVISTGGGSLEAIDGQGSLQLQSEITTDVVFNSISLQTGENQAGLVRIRDLSRPIYDGGGTLVDFVTTDYRSLNGSISIYDNYDPNTGAIIYAADEPNVPARLVQGPTVAATSSYATTANRDLVYVTQDVDLVRMARYKIELVQGDYRLGHDLPVSQLFRVTKIPLAVAPGYDLGTLFGFNEPIHNYAETPDGYSPVQASIGSGYDYNYRYERTNGQLRNGTYSYNSADNSFIVPVYGGSTARLTSLDRLSPDDAALLDQQQYFDNALSNYWAPTETGLTRAAVRPDDLNLWPSDQRLYGLIYDVDPTLRSAEDSLNKLHTIVHTEEFLFVETTTHEHRIRADKPIEIRFSGGQAGQASTLTSQGDIIFNGDVRASQNALSVTSNAGSILTGGPTVSLTAGALTLNAAGGVIADVGGGAARLNMAEGAIVNAMARDGVSLEEIGGALTVNTIRTTNRNNQSGATRVGGIDLRAAGAITQVAGGIISGTDVTLDARAGALGDGSAAPLRVVTDGGALYASAQGDIDILAPTGDLGLGSVSSITGSVRLAAAAGAVVDRNSEEVADLRTIEALEALWGEELGLTDPTRLAEREAAQIAAYDARVTAQYFSYWEARNQEGGTPIGFVLDGATETALRGTVDPSGDAANDRVQAYVTEQNALYALWNREAVFDAAYVYGAAEAEKDPALPLAAFRDAMVNDLAWTLEELTLSVAQGVVLPSADTNPRDESPNVSAAGDITITAANGVGEILSGYVIAAPSQPGQRLSQADLAVLAAALPGDLSVDANGNTVVRQEDDVNFALIGPQDQVAAGTLTVEGNAGDVFLASELDARVASITTAGRAELRIDGDLLNAGTIGTAITADSIQIESGVGGIGTAEVPFTVATGTNGTLQFGAGTSAYVVAPDGDIAIVAALAGDLLSLDVAGALTDGIGGAADRVFGGQIVLRADSIGTDTQTLGLRQTDPAGSVDVTATLGDIHIASQLGLTLAGFDSAAGGRIVTGNLAPLTFSGIDPVTFGATSTLAFTTGAPVISAGPTGTDITGGILTIEAEADWGTQAAPITTAVSTLRFGSGLPDGAAETSDLYLRNDGDLTVASLSQSDNPTSETQIAVAGDLEVTSAVTPGRLQISAAGGIGLQSTARLSAGTLDAVAQSGPVDITAFGQDSRITALQSQGAETPLSLRVESGTVTLAADAIQTIGGNQTLWFGEGLIMEAGQNITSNTGTIDLTVLGDLALGRIATGNATSEALGITVGGSVSDVDPASLSLVADAAGAGTTVQFTDTTASTPLRIKTALDLLTLDVAAQDVHLDEATAITLITASTGGSIFDLFATGDVALGDVTALDDIVISSLGGISTADADLFAPTVHLFGFGGSISTPQDAAYGVSLLDGAVLNQFARDNITTTFGTADGGLGYAIAQSGDLTIDRTLTGGTLSAEILAAGGTMTLRSRDSLDIDFIGRGEIDLIDEVALALVERNPNRFGTVAFTGPDHLIMEALNPDARIDIALAEIKQTADLNADLIDANLYDLTADDGLRLELSGAGGVPASRVDLNVIADDPAFTGTTGGGAPDISGRLIALIRPEDPGLPTSDGAVYVDFGRFETGEITTAGPELVVNDTIIGSDATFRQRLFDVFAETAFTGVREDMDGQILAVATNGLEAGELAFSMSERRQIDTGNILTNRPDPTSVVLGGLGGREETLAELAIFMSLDRDALQQGHVLLLPQGIGLDGYMTGLPVKGADEEDDPYKYLIYKSGSPPLVIIRQE